MAMNRNPYGIYGKCERCMRDTAIWRCQFRQEPEVKLCDRCADGFNREVTRKLAAEGLHPVMEP